MTPFGNFLEKIRRDRRLMQKQVASVLGITPTRESGIVDLQAKLIHCLHRILIRFTQPLWA